MEDLGLRIKTLRQQKNLTLRDVSESTGFSVSFLSQVEREISSLTITSLKRIAEALGVPLSYFFPPPAMAAYVVKKAERKDFRLDNQPIIYNSLSGDLDNKALEPLLLTFLPGEKGMRTDAYSHLGEEFGFILEGTLHVTVDGHEYQLHEGDSIHFSSTKTHSWENRSGGVVKAIWVSTPRLF